MNPLRARVRSGRLVLDEPTSLPEGTVLDLVADDEGDDLEPAERRALDDAIARAWPGIMDGHLRPAEAVIDELRKRS